MNQAQDLNLDHELEAWDVARNTKASQQLQIESVTSLAPFIPAG